MSYCCAYLEDYGMGRIVANVTGIGFDAEATPLIMLQNFASTSHNHSFDIASPKNTY